MTALVVSNQLMQNGLGDCGCHRSSLPLAKLIQLLSTGNLRVLGQSKKFIDSIMSFGIVCAE